MIRAPDQMVKVGMAAGQLDPETGESASLVAKTRTFGD